MDSEIREAKNDAGGMTDAQQVPANRGTVIFGESGDDGTGERKTVRP